MRSGLQSAFVLDSRYFTDKSFDVSGWEWPLDSLRPLRPGELPRDHQCVLADSEDYVRELSKHRPLVATYYDYCLSRIRKGLLPSRGTYGELVAINVSPCLIVPTYIYSCSEGTKKDLDSILEALWDAYKGGRDDMNALLGEYQARTGRERPGFMA